MNTGPIISHIIPFFSSITTSNPIALGITKISENIIDTSNLLNLKIGYKVTRHANYGFSQTSKNEFSNLTYLNSGKYL